MPRPLPEPRGSDWKAWARQLMVALAPQAVGDKRIFLSCKTIDSATLNSTSWANIHSAVTLVDEENQGIGRIDSGFTFTKPGLYKVDLRVPSHFTTGTIGFRLRIGSETRLAQVFGLNGFVSVLAKDTLVLQYIVSGGGSLAWSATTLGSEDLPMIRFRLTEVTSF